MFPHNVISQSFRWYSLTKNERMSWPHSNIQIVISIERNAKRNIKDTTCKNKMFPLSQTAKTLHYNADLFYKI